MEKGKTRADGIQQCMSASAPSPAGFNLYDLLTRVTPGLLVLTVLGITVIQTDALLEATSSSLFAVITLFAGFLVGEFIDSIRMSWFAAPEPFRRMIYEERRAGEKWTDFRDRLHNHHLLIRGTSNSFLQTQDEFWPVFKRRYEVSDELKDSNEIYLRLAADLDPQLTALTRRYQTTTTFIQNMRLAIPFAILLTLLSFNTETGISNAGRVGVLVLLIIPGGYLYLFQAIENTYVRLLLLQFDLDWPKQVEPDVDQKNLDEF